MIPHRLLPALLLTAGACAIPYFHQVPLSNAPSPSPNGDHDTISTAEKSPGGLSGRFLHITDFHPDGHYKSGTNIEGTACHRGHGSAGYFGAEGTDCDSPFTLVNETFHWIENNLKGKIDFVIWTGDSARHDSDEKHPRSEEEVLRLNQYLADKFADTFRSEDSPHGLSIPVVPTFGNNDILPHNIFKTGPNKWTKKYVDVWKKFIPEYQRHSFVEGGWFSVEVIPNKLAVMSLNTMYLFESNSAVDGCADKSEPGYEHMEWLRVQLKLLRSRHMKAILIGHVPPARSGDKRNWDETCWQKYALWVNRYRDVIVGSAYGHMNIDHFMLQDSHKVDIVKTQDSADTEASDKISVQSRTDYLSSLRKDWSKMPSPPDDMANDEWMDAWLEDAVTEAGGDLDSQGEKKRRRFLKKIGGPWAERYSVSLVSPSVVPNYLPTMRVVEYNITGLEDAATWAEISVAGEAVPELLNSDLTDEPSVDQKKGGQKKKPGFKIPEPPSSSSPPGPAYSNQPLTWLSYTQYYANLTKINGEVSHLAGSGGDDVPLIYEVEYDTKEDGIYHMKDLTVKSYFTLASRIADKNPPKDDTLVSDDYNEDGGLLEPEQKKKKPKNRVWRTFFKRAFVGLIDDDDLDDIES